MFLVKPSSLFTYTATADELQTLLSATYSYPCVNTPTKSKVWPCALFADITKQGQTGN